MNWFYKQSDREIGPVSAATLNELATCGVIANDTLVRKADSVDWIAYGEASGDETNSGEQVNPTDAIVRFHCPGCGQKISAGREDADKEAECPACGTTMIIPGSSPKAAAPSKLPPTSAADPGDKPEILKSPSSSSTPPPVPQELPSRSSPPPVPVQPGTASAPPESTLPQTNGKENKRNLKPILIGCGALLFVALVGTCGLVSAIVGAANQAVSENKSGGGGSPVPSNHVPGNAYQTQQTQPVMMPCMSCKGSGRKKVPCEHCKGSRTMQTRNGYVIVCPNCQGLGVATIPCGGCGGRGAVPYSRENIYAPRNEDYNPDLPFGNR